MLVSTVLAALALSAATASAAPGLKLHSGKASIIGQTNARRDTASWFLPNTGNCGQHNTQWDNIIAIPNNIWYQGMMDNGWQSEHCFACVKIYYNDKEEIAQVGDRCPDCPDDQIDLAKGLWLKLEPNEGKGLLDVNWHFTDCDSGDSAPAPAPETTTSEASATTTSTEAAVPSTEAPSPSPEAITESATTQLVTSSEAPRPTSSPTEQATSSEAPSATNSTVAPDATSSGVRSPVADVPAANQPTSPTTVPPIASSARKCRRRPQSHA